VGYYLSVNEPLPHRFRSNFRFTSVRNRGASDIHSVKPKSPCNRVAHRSPAAQNHIQVSAINAVVLRKGALTSFPFNCCSQQINDAIIIKYGLVMGLGCHGFIPIDERIEGGCSPFQPSLPSLVDREQVAYATLDDVDCFGGTETNRKVSRLGRAGDFGAKSAVGGQCERVLPELVVQILDTKHHG
jgi:hypothetical protein